MSEQELLETLRGVQFLHDVEEEYLRSIASIAELRAFPSDFVLFREGQTHPNIYLVVEGIVSLEIRVAPQVIKRIETVGQGELLGWSPLMNRTGQSEMTATARIQKPTRTLVIDAAQMMALCEHNPRFGFEFMRRTARALSLRLNATRLQLLDVYGHELPAAATGQEV